MTARKIKIQGQLLKVSTSNITPVRPPEKRGDVVGFSEASRKRMIEKILTMDLSKMGKPIFITLTYGKNYPDEKATKRHLQSFWKRLERKYSDLGAGLWRYELQERGAPHFHLLIWGVGFIPHQWVAKSWHGIVDPTDADLLKAGTRTEGIKTDNGTLFYVAKYSAKWSDQKTTGRVWGIFNRKAVIWAETHEFSLSAEHYEKAVKIYEKDVKKLSSREYGFSLYGRNVAMRIFGDFDKD